MPGDHQQRFLLLVKPAPISDLPIIQKLARNKERQAQQDTKHWIAKTQLATEKQSEVLPEAASPSTRLPKMDVPDEVTAIQKRSNEFISASSSAQSSVKDRAEGSALRSRATTSGAAKGLTALKQENQLSQEKVNIPSSTHQQEHMPRISISGPRDQSRYRSQQPIRKARSAKSQTTEEQNGYTTFSPFQPVKPRLSSSSRVSSTFTAVHMQEYVENSQVPTSTLDEFEYILQLPRKGQRKAHEPLEALFRVIHDDTDSLVDIIRVTLRRIREGTLDEDLMQKRVTFWRTLLHRLNFSLSDLDQHLRSFADFTSESGSNIVTSDREDTTTSMKLANSTHATLQYCIDLIERCSSSLLAEMQIVDSRRSITEAESISKLTELAFVFIPLSFVASLFSMQIHQLSNGVSVYLFVLVAIIFVVLAYAIRLSVRSSSIVDHKNEMLRQLREDSGLQYNQSIPTRIFLAWSTRILGTAAWRSTKKSAKVVAPLLLILAALAALISPIALLWLRNIDKGFSAVITVLMLLLDLILLCPVAVDSNWISLSPREIIREMRKDRAAKKNAKARRTARAYQRDVLDPEAQLPEDFAGSMEDI
ncbi:hypothetical protein HBH64_143280 [Parastagonospora nodorum]|nr:hypothetical protein HBH52_088480 [Parastagonospora nodorum]KAH4301639.1 hypothetical protein HBI01_095320 [Parastagonospora nodorum]KAH4306284.1 hypothetical protein HBI02_115710 [Parastagonospora nodorum]KAH4330941.1 hypothetical protein HBI00_083270 [Parastagonospora nodorum]KAH4368849.1 hypothetical protein HBH94_128650 [Parastagonospora nodorum]